MVTGHFDALPLQHDGDGLVQQAIEFVHQQIRRDDLVVDEFVHWM